MTSFASWMPTASPSFRLAFSGYLATISSVTLTPAISFFMNIAFFLLMSGMIPQRIRAPVSSLIRRSLTASPSVNTGWVRKNSAPSSIFFFTRPISTSRFFLPWLIAPP